LPEHLLCSDAPVTVLVPGASSCMRQNVSVADIMTNPRADRVKAVRALSRRSARERSGRYLVEGPQGVREAVRYAAGSVRDVYLTVEASQRYPEILDAATAADVYTHLAAPDVLAQMSPDAQGVL